MAIYGIFSYQPSNGLLTGYGFFFVLYSSFLLIMMWSDMEQQIIMNPQLALFAILGLCYQLLLQPDQLFPTASHSYSQRSYLSFTAPSYQRRNWLGRY